MIDPLVILSWGCGVQSTALAVMSALGDLPKLDAVIFADTGWERKATYETRDFYKTWLEDRGISVHVVSAGDVRVQGHLEHIHIPFWTETGGPLMRQCTNHFKIVPIKHEVRRLLGFDPSKPPHPKPGSVEQWQGISLDEYQRMKSSRVKYMVHRFPLVEKRITRMACIEYLEDKGLPVPVKSACVGCPYRAASEWAEMRDKTPGEFADAVEFDELHRHNPLATRGAGSTADNLYIYKNGKGIPLQMADLEADAKRERLSKQLPLILCDGGYCHV